MANKKPNAVEIQIKLAEALREKLAEARSKLTENNKVSSRTIMELERKAARLEESNTKLYREKNSFEEKYKSLETYAKKDEARLKRVGLFIDDLLLLHIPVDKETLRYIQYLSGRVIEGYPFNDDY
jgi:predicted nuclease with TOPRIM domain